MAKTLPTVPGSVNRVAFVGLPSLTRLGYNLAFANTGLIETNGA